MADEAVFAAGVNHHIKLLARALEGVGELPRVGGVWAGGEGAGDGLAHRGQLGVFAKRRLVEVVAPDHWLQPL